MTVQRRQGRADEGNIDPHRTSVYVDPVLATLRLAVERPAALALQIWCFPVLAEPLLRKVACLQPLGAVSDGSTTVGRSGAAVVASRAGL